MLEIIKYGTNKYGVWIIGSLKYQEFEIKDIFSTNLKNEDSLKDSSTLKIKKIKISRSKNGNIHFNLEF